MTAPVDLGAIEARHDADLSRGQFEAHDDVPAMARELRAEVAEAKEMHASLCGDLGETEAALEKAHAEAGALRERVGAMLLILAPPGARYYDATEHDVEAACEIARAALAKAGGR